MAPKKKSGNPWARGKYRKQAEGQEAYSEDVTKRLNPGTYASKLPSAKMKEKSTRDWQKWDKIASKLDSNGKRLGSKSKAKKGAKRKTAARKAQ